MNQTKKLIFEGAGWDKAEHNGVGNCRIRTRIKNKEGKVIYLECTSLKKNDDFIGFIDHCFDMVDENSNYTPDLKPFERMRFKYTKKGLIDFVNLSLNCDFDSLEVVNDGSVRVHDTKKPLCECV